MDDNLSIENISKKIKELEDEIQSNDVDISMSSTVNNLDLNNDEYNEYNISKDSNIIENFDFDEIIDNEDIVKNKFIKYISENSNLKSTPYFSTVNYYFYKEIYNNIFKKNYKNKFIIILLRIVHILEIIFLFVGLFLPSKLLPIYIILCMKHLIFWDIFDDKHYISILVKKLSGKKYYDLFNENINYLKTVLLVCIFISIYGILFSKFNLFKGVYSSVIYFNNYN
jgi:hypothetical protein